jgi:hypothetical protein
MSNLHQFNPGKKSWKMYANTITSISGDDLTITPYDGEDIILEVSGNGSILFKEDGITYTIADLSNVASSGGSGSVVEANGGFRSLTTDTNVGTDSISIGYQCGNSSQGTKSIAIGYESGKNIQGGSSIAIGYESGKNIQGGSSIAIGAAGRTNQGSHCVAIGYQCANNYQGQYSIAIGLNSQRVIQNQQDVVSIGYGSAELNAKTGSVSVGTYAGQNGGQYSLNLGYYANRQGNHNNTITLNATGVAVNSTQSDTFVVKPIRNNTGVTNALFYDTSSGEITYDSAIDMSFQNIDISGSLTFNTNNGQANILSQSQTELNLFSNSSDTNSYGYIQLNRNSSRHTIIGGEDIIFKVGSTTDDVGTERFKIDNNGDIYITGSLKIDDVEVPTINTNSLSNYTLTSDLQSGNLDLSFNNVDISGTLKMNNIQSIQDISSGLGEIDVSFVNNTLSIDAKNMLYATKYFNYTSNVDISNLDVTNFQNNAQIVINLDNSGTVVFRGSNNGGINNSKINFVYDISLNNTNSILTLTKLNENIFLMVSEFK